MDSHPFTTLHPEEYQRLRDAAKLRALRLRQEAIREAGAWAADALRGWFRCALQCLRRPQPLARRAAVPRPSSLSSTQEPQAPCQPSY